MPVRWLALTSPQTLKRSHLAAWREPFAFGKFCQEENFSRSDANALSDPSLDRLTATLSLLGATTVTCASSIRLPEHRWPACMDITGPLCASASPQMASCW